MDNDDFKDGYILIDPPVWPWSPPDEICAWIKELESMPQIPAVPEALADARSWLADAEKTGSEIAPGSGKQDD